MTDIAIAQFSSLGYDVTPNGTSYIIAERTNEPTRVVFEVHSDNDLIHMATVLKRMEPYFQPREPRRRQTVHA